ncbi:MAG TPA: hypothetical protein VGK26_12135 [Thermoanaerobaculia bacterium]
MTTASGRLRERIAPWLIAISPFLELLGATFVLLALVFSRLFTNSFAYFSADHSELYFPWWVFINQSVRSGTFPVLNRFWFSGSLPFAALETGVFYPPTMFFQLLFDAKKDLDHAYYFFLASILLHYLLASLAFYLLATLGLRLRRFPALFGSLVFCCSGSFIGRFVHPLLLVNLAWVPLAYLFFLLFLRDGRVIHALAAAVVLALIVAAGHPQMVYYTFLVFGFTAMVAALTARVNRPLILAFSAFIVIVGVLLVAQKVFLGVELANNIVRLGALESSENLFNSLHPLYYLTLLAPYLYGRHGVAYWGSQYHWGNWENFLYVGLLPILCLPFCVFWKNRRLLTIFGSGLALSVLISLGRFSALSALLNRSLPFSSSLGYLSKITVLFHFFLVVLVTVGFQELCELTPRKRRVACGVAAAAFLLLFVVLTRGTVSRLAPNGYPAPSEVAREFAFHNVVVARWLFLLVAVLIGAPLLLGRRAALRFVLPIYALDLVINVSGFNPIDSPMGAPSDYLGPTAATEAIQKDRGIYRAQNLRPVNVNMVAGIETTYGYHTVATRSYAELLGSLAPEYRGLLDLLGVRYYVGRAGGSGLLPVAEALWKSPSATTRVSFVPAYQTVPDEDEMRQRVLSPAFDPRRAVFLESSVSARLPAGFRVAAQTPAGAPETPVRIQEYSATSVRASLEAPTDGLLLFGQTRYPGWEAILDGAPATLLPADLSFYALPVARGPHRVEFRFRSRPLLWGLAVAGITGGLAVLLLLLPGTRGFFVVPFFQWGKGAGAGREGGPTSAVPRGDPAERG